MLLDKRSRMYFVDKENLSINKEIRMRAFEYVTNLLEFEEYYYVATKDFKGSYLKTYDARSYEKVDCIECTNLRTIKVIEGLLYYSDYNNIYRCNRDLTVTGVFRDSALIYNFTYDHFTRKIIATNASLSVKQVNLFEKNTSILNCWACFADCVSSKTITSIKKKLDYSIDLLQYDELWYYGTQNSDNKIIVLNKDLDYEREIYVSESIRKLSLLKNEIIILMELKLSVFDKQFRIIKEINYLKPTYDILVLSESVILTTENGLYVNNHNNVIDQYDNDICSDRDTKTDIESSYVKLRKNLTYNTSINDNLSTKEE